MFSVPPDYADLTYKPSGRDRPNPRDISNALLHGRSGLPSYTNKTVLFVFFGQFRAEISGSIRIHGRETGEPSQSRKIKFTLCKLYVDSVSEFWLKYCASPIPV